MQKSNLSDFINYLIPNELLIPKLIDLSLQRGNLFKGGKLHLSKFKLIFVWN